MDLPRKRTKLDQQWINIELDEFYQMHSSCFPNRPFILVENPKYCKKNRRDLLRKRTQLNQQWRKIELDVFYPMHCSLPQMKLSSLRKTRNTAPKPLKLAKNRSQFAQKADQTKFTIEQDRTQYALCDVLLTFPNDLFILEKTPKYCRKALETGEKSVTIR
jgi:hypothetical protein